MYAVKSYRYLTDQSSCLDFVDPFPNALHDDDGDADDDGEVDDDDVEYEEEEEEKKHQKQQQRQRRRRRDQRRRRLLQGQESKNNKVILLDDSPNDGAISDVTEATTSNSSETESIISRNANPKPEALMCHTTEDNSICAEHRDDSDDHDDDADHEPKSSFFDLFRNMTTANRSPRSTATTTFNTVETETCTNKNKTANSTDMTRPEKETLVATTEMEHAGIGRVGTTEIPSTLGRRRQRTEKVASVYINPEKLRACRNVQLECSRRSDSTPMMTLRQTDLWRAYDEVMNKYYNNNNNNNNNNNTNTRDSSSWINIQAQRQTQSHPDIAVVAVEATHICSLDVSIRQGLILEHVREPFVLGSNFVGIVHRSTPSSSSLSSSSSSSFYPEGTRVAAFSVTGANARYISIPTTCVVPVPKQVDAGEMVCVLSCYLPAFQALYHGRTNIPSRDGNKYGTCWNNKSLQLQLLQGQRILLTLGASLEEMEAMVQLAYLAGAARVYIICRSQYHSFVSETLKATPLDDKDWLRHVRARMDVVIDYDYSSNRSIIAEAMIPKKGRLVWFWHPPTRPRGSSVLWDMQQILDQARMCYSFSRASIYDLHEYWEFHREECIQDLQYLLELLGRRRIRPKVDRYIGLDGIAQAHVDLQQGNIRGAIICEPWKDS